MQQMFVARRFDGPTIDLAWVSRDRERHVHLHNNESTRLGTCVRTAAIATALLAVVARPSVLSAQIPSKPRAPDSTSSGLQYVRVVGVFDAESGEAIPGAEVIDEMARRTVVSSARGIAPLTFADTGASLIEVRKVGYTPDVVLIRHSPGDTIPVTVVLRRASDSQILPKVVVTDSAPAFISPALRGFEERRRTGLGHFLTESELRASEHRKLADLLQARVPGILIQRGRGSNVLASPRAFSLTGAAKAPVCYPDAYLDGVRMNRVGGGVNLDDFQVSDLAGVEFHNIATVPVQFNATGSGCGVLLLWTRER
jgi:hypothetical protein